MYILAQQRAKNKDYEFESKNENLQCQHTHMVEP